MSRLDVLPGLSMEDGMDSLSADAELLSEFAFAELMGQSPNLDNLLLGECPSDGRMGFVQTGCTRMLHILRPANLLKIGKAVVCPIAVQVVAFFTRRERASEGGENEAVNGAALSPALAPEVNIGITRAAEPWVKNIASSCTHHLPNTPYPSEIGDFVETFISDDGEPGFLRQGELCRLRGHREPPVSVSCGRAPHSVAATLII